MLSLLDHQLGTRVAPEGLEDERGTTPGVFEEIDFTELRPRRYGHKYLLVLVDTFSGCTEAFTTKGETAKKLIKEIIPRCGIAII